ncbi:MAG: ATP-binding protein, partial [Verrucomicrobia bacterium]|nr:ATP-binding protein [Verrucomicrobiota bacterium]
MAKKYDEKAVQTLDAISHIRLRSGMYIGRLGDGSHPDDGIYILLKEVIDNSIDEFIMNHGKQIEVSVDLSSGRAHIRDFGRGIPLGKVVDCVSQMNTGAKYNDDVFQFSVGLNGVGLKAVNALSSHFLVRSTREGKFFEAIFNKGVLVSSNQGASVEPAGTYVEFTPDKEIFKDYRYSLEIIQKRMWHYAYLNCGLKL